jgi:hypothetical protein
MRVETSPVRVQAVVGGVKLVADPEHLKLLEQGVDVWNAWRSEKPSIRPDLSGADLRRANLTGADLSMTYLAGTILQNATLDGANLRFAYLAGAALDGANLAGAILVGANLAGADLRKATLEEANLRFAILREADLGGAILRWADSAKRARALRRDRALPNWHRNIVPDRADRSALRGRARRRCQPSPPPHIRGTCTVR